MREPHVAERPLWSTSAFVLVREQAFVSHVLNKFSIPPVNAEYLADDSFEFIIGKWSFSSTFVLDSNVGGIHSLYSLRF